MAREIIITFDDSSKKSILNLLGFEIKDNGLILSKDDKIITDPDFNEIKISEFGGILQGSKVAIKKDTLDVVKYFFTKL